MGLVDLLKRKFRRPARGSSIEDKVEHVLATDKGVSGINSKDISEEFATYVRQSGWMNGALVVAASRARESLQYAHKVDERFDYNSYYAEVTGDGRGAFVNNALEVLHYWGSRLAESRLGAVFSPLRRKLSQVLEDRYKDQIHWYVIGDAKRRLLSYHNATGPAKEEKEQDMGFANAAYNVGRR